jgi:extradiol dioxygenase family protein
LDAARAFYLDVLGCRIGRDKGTWMDVLFFGHQLTIHQETDRLPARAIDHFGPVLDKPTWMAIAESCRAHSVQFEVQPRVVGKSNEAESGKFAIRDPAGNLLEFKYYEDFASTVGDDGT